MMDSDCEIEAQFTWLVNLVVNVPQADPEGVNIWLDGDVYTSPLEITVKACEHSLEVQESFLKEWAQGIYYLYTFDYWSDGSKDNPRTLDIDSDTTLTAYYKQSDYPIGILGDPLVIAR